jgi:hypothetical protein
MDGIRFSCYRQHHRSVVPFMPSFVHSFIVYHNKNAAVSVIGIVLLYHDNKDNPILRLPRSEPPLIQRLELFGLSYLPSTVHLSSTFVPSIRCFAPPLRSVVSSSKLLYHFFDCSRWLYGWLRLWLSTLWSHGHIQ